MKRGNVIGIMLVLSVLILACSGERYKYVNATVVEIEYYDSIMSNEWILIDGIKFEHKSNYESIKTDSSSEDDFYRMNILPTSIQDIAFEADVKSGKKDFALNSYYDDATMVNELFTRLAMMDDEEGNRKYSFMGNLLTVATGKIKFKRVNGDKIKISTSDGYGAAVRTIE